MRPLPWSSLLLPDSLPVLTLPTAWSWGDAVLPLPILPDPWPWLTLPMPDIAAIEALLAWLPPRDPEAPEAEPEPDSPEPPLALPGNAAPILAGGAEHRITIAAGTGGVVHRVEATDPEGDLMTWRIAGGADAWRVMLDPGTGALGFLTPPDATEEPLEVLLRVTDGWGASATQRLLLDVAEAAQPTPPLAYGDPEGEGGLPEPLPWTPRDWAF